jgi:hypothetical protein
MAHCGTHRVGKDIVMAAPAPEWTDTWHPIAHGKIIQAVTAAAHDLGMGIREEAYSLSKNAGRMFGAITLDTGTPQIGHMIGIRNGVDKSLKLGLCGGTNVFVCDNLCFSGEFIAMRKHTSGLDMEELEKIAREAMGGAIIEMEKLTEWQNRLHETWVPKQDRKALWFDMITKGVFPPSQLNNYMGCLKDEMDLRKGRSLDNAHSLYNIHGAATRLMRSWPIDRATVGSANLIKVCDDYLEQRAA